MSTGAKLVFVCIASIALLIVASIIWYYTHIPPWLVH